MAFIGFENLIKRLSGKGLSAADYDASRPPDMGEGLYALQRNKSGLNLDDISNDPIYNLELQAIDASTPSGGGGGNLGARLAQAAAQNAYGGPSLEDLRRYGQEGQSRISNLYGQLSQYMQGKQAETANLYNAGQMRAGAAYENAAKDIAAGQQQAASNIASSTAGLSAGKEAAQEAAAAANASIQRQAALNATNKANALASMQSLGTGHQAILNDLLSGTKQEQQAQSGRFSDQVNNLIARAQAEMAAAAQKSAMAQQSIRESEANRQSEAAGKSAAAKIRALEDAIKRAKSESGKSDQLSGIQGVLSYAARANKPQLAKQFLDMLGASRANAATINAAAKADRAQGKMSPLTTADEQLQTMLGGITGNRLDIASEQDPRGELLRQIQTNPALKNLQKYIITNPDEARRQGQYQAAFGRSEQSYNDMLNRLRAFSRNQPSPTLNRIQGDRSQAFINEMNKRFTPFINMDLLRRNRPDVESYYGAFGTGNQDFMSTLFDIYSGRYGKG
jgi:hypothetical protein